MSASLVGSEMCIRDRSSRLSPRRPRLVSGAAPFGLPGPIFGRAPASADSCLLYTSDAADDM
eukprot:2394472-Alexandrium_andersonii.AAC.1